MPISLDLDASRTSRQLKTLPSGENATSQSPSQTSAGDGCSSASSHRSPVVSTTVDSPTSPITKSSTSVSDFKSPQPSAEINVSRMAVLGSSKASPRYQGIKAYLAGKGLGASVSGLAQEPLQEEPNVLEEETPVKGLADGDIIELKPVHNVKNELNDRIIAVDFDDVCSQYIPKLCAEHNAKYGTDITPEDFKTYIFFQNRGWGTPAETQRKLEQLEQDTALAQIAPVPGFATALRALKALGHQIHIVTARAEPFKASIITWLGMHGVTVGSAPADVIAEVWCCSSYSKGTIPEPRPTKSGLAEEEQLNVQLLGMFGKGKSGMSKLKVLRAINASLFIDDHHGNLEPIISSANPIPCLLFGDYPWNRSRSGFNTPGEFMTFEQRMQAGLDITVEDIEMGLFLHRVKGWADVVEWVKLWDEKAEDDTD